MHSQQMFNECIARAAVNRNRGFPKKNPIAMPTVHMFSRILTDLPAANPEKEANDIALLLLGELFEVLEGAHFACAESRRSAFCCQNEK